MDFLEGIVKSRVVKKEQRKKARVAFKAEDRRRKLDDVRVRTEERIERQRGRSFVQKPVKQAESKVSHGDKDSDAASAEQKDAVVKPLDPHNIHGGSLAADQQIRSKMVPGDSMYAQLPQTQCLNAFPRFISCLNTFLQRTNSGAHRRVDAAVPSGLDRRRV